MARRALTGSRIRRIRMDRGIRQAHLAEACGISPSYLNLIEHNKRAIGGALIGRLAKVLRVDPAELAEGAEAALTEALETAAGAMGTERGADEKVEDLASRFPGWSRLIRDQYERIVELERVVETLNDRLTHDPFLSASLHNVLSSVTAIRSTSGILASGDQIEPAWQTRFHRNLLEDSQRLADAAGGLVSYLDAGGDTSQAQVLPQDELQSWLAAQGWRIDALENGSGADPDRIVDAASELRTAAAKSLARAYLRRYAADAAALPHRRLAALIGRGTPDPGLIARELGADLALTMRRLATLPGENFLGGLAPGLVACDGSGTLTFRKPVRGFEPPRYGAACAVWPLYQALQRPTMPIRADVVVAGRDEAHFQVHAISNLEYPAGYGAPAVAEAVMILMPRLAQADDSRATLAMGTSCRVCAIADCPARREPSILAPQPASDLV